LIAKGWSSAVWVWFVKQGAGVSVLFSTWAYKKSKVALEV